MTESQPGILSYYDRARAILSRGLESSRLDVVLTSRDDLDHIKLHARKVRDRTLLADAYEFQMRVERRLGVLIAAARDAGHLRRHGQRGAIGSEDGPAKLHEIGIDGKLSSKAKAFASLDEQSFGDAVSSVRERIASGRAKPASVIDDALRCLRRRGISASCDDDPFSFPLADGTSIGQVKIGKLRSRMDRLAVELTILSAVNDRVGTGADALATVEESISKASLGQIIAAAKG